MKEYHYSRRVVKTDLDAALMAAFGPNYMGSRVNESGFTVFLGEDVDAIDVNAIVEAQDLAIVSCGQTSVAAGGEVEVTVWLPYTAQPQVRISIEGLPTEPKALSEDKRASWTIAADASLDGALSIGVPDHPHEPLEIEVRNDIA
ncbi:hypothetical protein G4Y79_20925 [Phototrophicus methaneseepsis]|uniref:Uncharacterized protein n=1 Tax=Phototrophicus methaneseepsis TaxID=2710758 RepID=A0A7S8E850_9CHLR|nr:hypothetical protein [Phototrophicus methaneseepsis]QPC82121.1 hypothetical protein G4Y79_20925 [Phototrophicus methaneseepsis]